LSQPKKKTKNELMTTEIVRLFPHQGECTENEYFWLPDTNYLVELSEGRLLIQEMPGDDHQNAIGNLFAAIYFFIHNKGLGKVRTSPLPVRLWKDKVREPDIVFMSKAHGGKIRKKYWGVPDLVVEAISKSTEKVDRVEKFAEYAQAGVSEYWIVDTINQTIEVFTLEQKSYVLLGRCGMGEMAQSKVIEGFEVKVDSVMEKK
jgi:Uma2 family endonuclease